MSYAIPAVCKGSFQDILKNTLRRRVDVDCEEHLEGIRHPVPRHARIDDQLILRPPHILQERIDLVIDIFLHLGGNIRRLDGFPPLVGDRAKKVSGRKMPVSERFGNCLRRRRFPRPQRPCDRYQLPFHPVRNRTRTGDGVHALFCYE